MGHALVSSWNGLHKEFELQNSLHGGSWSIRMLYASVPGRGDGLRGLTAAVGRCGCLEVNCVSAPQYTAVRM